MATRAPSRRRHRRGTVVAGVAAVAAILVGLAVAMSGPPPSGWPWDPMTVAERSDRGNPDAPSRLLFATRPDDGLSEFPGQVHPERISVVEDPAGGAGEDVLRFEVYNSDTGPTDNPRAQLESPSDFEEGDDRYIGAAIRLPAEFPTELPERGWVTLASMAYGPPYDGDGPVGLRLQNHVEGGGAELRWQRNDTYGNDIPWIGPKVAEIRGRWIGFVVRVKLHSDPDVGFVELWMDTGSGWKQQKLAGRDRLYMATYDSSNDGGANNSRVGLYYRRDIQGPLTVFHSGLTIASAGKGAFLAVAPRSDTSRRSDQDG